MAQNISTAALVGCTGLVGSNILNVLLDLPSEPIVHAITRRDLSNPSPNLKSFIEGDNAKWTAAFTNFEPKPNIFFSALGTTRGAAGSFENQRKIDYDLNLALAKEAKESGVEVYVLISSAGVSKTSPFPYGKMKVELEEAVSAIGFKHTIILRPGLLVGARQDTRLAEGAMRKVATGLGMISGGLLKDFWAQDADVIARAAVAAGEQALQGETKEAVVSLSQADIVRMGKKKSGAAAAAAAAEKTTILIEIQL